MTVRNIGDIKRGMRMTHWFSRGTMQFFSSKVRNEVFPTCDGGAYFVTSESCGDGVRAYSVRRYSPGDIDGDGEIRTVGEFMYYPCASPALQAAEAACIEDNKRP